MKRTKPYFRSGAVTIAAMIAIFAAGSLRINAGVLYPELISRSTNVGTANAQSVKFSVSANGRFMAFESSATNLVPGLTDFNNTSDIFFYDSTNNTTRCLSLTVTTPNKTGNSASSDPLVSADGRYVVFHTAANDLFQGDANNKEDIIRYDTVNNVSLLVSYNTALNAGGNGDSGLGFSNARAYDMSDDGRYVAFISAATDLTNVTDTNNATDVYVRDTQTQSTRLVSIDSTGNFAGNNPQNVDVNSIDVNISGDGKMVSFQSGSTNLVAGLNDGNLNYDVYVRNLQTGQTRCASVRNNNGSSTGDRGSFAPVMSRNGNRVSFVSESVTIGGPPTNNFANVFVYDIGLRTNILVSVNLNGSGGGNQASEFASSAAQQSITPDGRYVVFSSSATDLDPTVSNYVSTPNIFRRDLATGVTQLVNLNAARTGSTNFNASDGKQGRSVSDDGRFVLFGTVSSDVLEEGFTGGNGLHTFVRDMLTGTSYTATLNLNGNGLGQAGDVTAEISRNGRVVMFSSLSNDLTPNDQNAAADTFRTQVTIPQMAQSDFDRDGLSDFAVYRPSQGAWYVLNNQATSASYRLLGNATDLIVPADYNGDGRTDYAVFRPSNGMWYVSDALTFNEVDTSFGQNGDVPVPQDYDGDGKADLAVFRAGTFYWVGSQTGQVSITQFGLAGDTPLIGDFDGDGKADLAVFRPSTGSWYYRQSRNGTVVGNQFGQAGDKPVPGDYDGDGKTDVAVYRAGVWWFQRSHSGVIGNLQFGLANDIPAAADYDGDGLTDFAVFRPSDGNWYVLRSLDGTLRSVHFGQSGDTPVPSALNH